jgi:uncharacterized protein
MEKHLKKCGVVKSYCSSINSIFYSDPFHGDIELNKAINQKNEYRHILTVNPRIPGYVYDIEKGIEKFDISGVKIFPSYHGYDLDSNILLQLCKQLQNYNLPLFISLRLEHKDMNYILDVPECDIKNAGKLLNKVTNIDLVFLTIRSKEIYAVKEYFSGDSNVYFDTSGLKDGLFAIEKLLEKVDYRQMLYGSLYPMYPLKSTYFLVERAMLDESVKEAVFFGNAERVLLGKGGGKRL